MRDIHIINAVIQMSESITAKVSQWAYGLELNFIGIDLPDGFEAHFCNEGDSVTKTSIGINNRVRVLDEYLETGKNIKCYLFLHDAETDGRTVRTITIPIVKRPKPSDLEPTPVQQDAITQAIGAMQAARADIESIAEDAHQAIEDALDETVEETVAQKVAEAVEEAKESGEFKGDKGDPGQDGVDGKDGKDGKDGADGKDGTNGTDGADGHSPVVTASKSGTVTTISVDGTAIATVNDGDDYLLTDADKRDIANLVDIDSKADAVIIHVGDVVSGNMYEIDRTYSEIRTALGDGANVVLTGGSAGVCPYVGVMSENGTYAIAFGVSATYNGMAALYGYLVLPNNYAMRVEQYTAIPVNLSDLTDDVGYVKNITANKSGKVTTIYSDGTAIATINDGADGNDYTLTAQDKADIANLVIQILPTAQGVSF